MPADKTIDTVLMIIAGGALTLGLGSVLLGWLVRQWDHIMSRSTATGATQNSNQEPAFSPATTTPATSNNALQSDATYSKGLLDGQARALAIAVRAGKYGETEGLKAVFGVSPSSTNRRYIDARAALKAELARLDNPYPTLEANRRPRWEPEQEAA
jgi:hypothetical protein